MRIFSSTESHSLLLFSSHSKLVRQPARKVGLQGATLVCALHYCLKLATGEVSHLQHTDPPGSMVRCLCFLPVINL